MDGEWTYPPFTFGLRDRSAYASITEGALVHYSGMVFQVDATQALHARLGHAIPPSWDSARDTPRTWRAIATPAVIDGPITTPWRIVMIGADLNALVNCDIVHNVAAPPDPKLFPKGLHTDWIKPGRAVWMLSRRRGFHTRRAERDGPPRFPTGIRIHRDRGLLAEQLVRGAVEGCHWLHARAWSEGLRVEHPLPVRRTPRPFSRPLEICDRVGIAGLKIDFFDHEHKR